MPNQADILVNTTQELTDVIQKIEDISIDADYIYRGEPEHYSEDPYHGIISSNLFRQYLDIEVDDFDIEEVQDEILTEAEAYSHDTNDPFEILTQLQHYGGKTNLIDFTTDYLVALFFACDSSDSLKKDGRIILLQKTDEFTDWIKIPRNPRHRVIAQKSVFVRHPKGYFSPEDLTIINIPAYLKLSLLEHLRKYHGLSTDTIYNDLHGFIINQSIHESAYTEFHRGLSYYIMGDDADNLEEKQKKYEKAILHYTKALKLKPDLPEGYNNRANAYRDNGEFDKAIEDYKVAIEVDPQDAVPYNNRGVAYLNEGKVGEAIIDFTKAIECDPEDANAYNNLGVALFENNEVEKAIKEYSTAIELIHDFADAYRNRGIAWLHLRDWEKAKEDLTVATELGVDIVALFIRTYESIEGFEQTYNVKLPKDIAEILTDEE